MTEQDMIDAATKAYARACCVVYEVDHADTHLALSTEQQGQALGDLAAAEMARIEHRLKALDQPRA